MTLANGVLTERRLGSWHECWVCGYLMGLHYAGVAFPYTAAERDWFDPTNVAGNLGEMDTLTQRRYNTHLDTPTDSLASLLAQTGIMLVVNGTNSRMTKAMHHWDTAYMGEHTMAVEPLGNGTSRVYDPEATQGFAGEVFPTADILYWADKTPGSYRIAKEPNVQYELKVEQWLLDGKTPVVTVGAPIASTGKVDYSQRLTITSQPGAAYLRLTPVGRVRLTAVAGKVSPASDPFTKAIEAALAAFALPSAGLTQADVDKAVAAQKLADLAKEAVDVTAAVTAERARIKTLF